jgi:lysozyme family protein
MQLFDLALELVLEHEGGYVNDPKDPGGETIYGISRRAHPDAWRNGTPSKDQAAQIYLNDYWLAADCPELQPAVAVFLFDTAVNVGVRQSVRLLQRALRVTDDGILGPITRGAANKADPAELLPRLAAERLAHYAALSTWQRFGRGWSKRTVQVAMACALIQNN